MVEFTDDDLQGSRFWRGDFSGSQGHGGLLQNLKITDPVFADPKPFHPLGYPPDDAESGRALGLDIDASPSLDEILDLRRERMARVAQLLRTASHDDLM